MSVNLVTYRPSYQTLFVGVAAVSIVALLAYALFSRKSSQQSTPKSVPQSTPIPLSAEQAKEIKLIKDKILGTIPLIDKLDLSFPFGLWKKLSDGSGVFIDPETSAKVDLKNKVIQLNSEDINAQKLDKIFQYMKGNIICSYNSGSSADPRCIFFYRKDASSFVHIPEAPSTSRTSPNHTWVNQCKNNSFASHTDYQHADNETIYNTLLNEKETISFEKPQQLLLHRNHRHISAQALNSYSAATLQFIMPSTFCGIFRLSILFHCIR